MTLEEKYAVELKNLGIYNDAFKPVIHQLAILEREQSRVRDEWKLSTESWRNIKEARRKAKDAEKIAETLDITKDAARAWKETAEAWETAATAWQEAAEEWEDHPLTNKLYAVILQQDKLILSLRESLGLTPKALRRLKPGFGEEPEEDADQKKTPLELLIEKRRTAV